MAGGGVSLGEYLRSREIRTRHRLPNWLERLAALDVIVLGGRRSLGRCGGARSASTRATASTYLWVPLLVVTGRQ